MGTHPDMADDSFLLLFFYIVQKFSFHNTVKLCLFIHKMNHSQIDIICSETNHKVFKCLFDFAHLSGPDILPSLPGGAKVPLYDPPVSFPLQCLSNICADIGL